MPTIKMYKTPSCPFCHRATALLKTKGVTDVQELDIAADPSLRDTMLKESGGRKTVPQIFIGGRHIGGFDDLAALDKAGELEPLLK